LIAALNPHTGAVFGEVYPDRKLATLMRSMEAVAEQFSGAAVHVVWDNLDTHLDGRDWRLLPKELGSGFWPAVSVMHSPPLADSAASDS
jgi:hypothetical protein